MLRMCFVQQWYTLSDELLEHTLYDSQAMREFVGVDLAREQVPDATTLLKFRRLLEQHDLARAILEQVNAYLAEQGLLMRQGTLVDATIIAAPSSTKNDSGKRDPEMHQAKKGNEVEAVLLPHVGRHADGIAETGGVLPLVGREAAPASSSSGRDVPDTLRHKSPLAPRGLPRRPRPGRPACGGRAAAGACAAQRRCRQKLAKADMPVSSDPVAGQLVAQRRTCTAATDDPDRGGHR